MGWGIEEGIKHVVLKHIQEVMQGAHFLFTRMQQGHLCWLPELDWLCGCWLEAHSNFTKNGKVVDKQKIYILTMRATKTLGGLITKEVWEQMITFGAGGVATF